MKWGLLLFVFGCVKVPWLVRCFVVRVSEDAAPGAGIADLESGSCALEQILLPRFAEGFVRADAGRLWLSRALDCERLLLNPFTVLAVLDCAGNASGFRHLLTSRYSVHVHGKKCAVRRGREGELDAEVISLTDALECREAHSAVFRVSDALPGHPTHCNVTGTSSFYVSDGLLFSSVALCFARDALLEFELRCVGRAGVAHAHWRVGRGPYTQTHLRQVLERAARSHSGLLSRRTRSVNNNPQFQPPMYQVSVPENQPSGTFVVALRAVDPDEGEAGRLEYFLEALFDSRSNNQFVVDPASGIVSCVEILDRETKDTHMFRVTAVDHGTPRRTAMAFLTVTVSDTNDHDPVFEQQDYKKSVRENLEIGYEVLTVRATDGDAPVNGNILYHLLNNNGTDDAFEIDSRSGVIRTRGVVDRETVESYVLLVEANDQGRDPGPRSATATVHIVVEDDNDNAPIFVSTPFQATVLENVPIGYSIIHIQAVDADAGDNSRLEYRLTETTPNFPFAINNSTGWIVVASELDRESVDFYNFGVEARDHGAPAMSSSAGISMTILDVNDNNPEFTQKAYYMRLNEDAAVGTSVTRQMEKDETVGESSPHIANIGRLVEGFSIFLYHISQALTRINC